MRARFVILANGIPTTPKLARIAGMEKFQGESFHTSRWNYNIDLSGKRPLAPAILRSSVCLPPNSCGSGAPRPIATRISAHVVCAVRRSS
jgi:hypothetical protein